MELDFDKLVYLADGSQLIPFSSDLILDVETEIVDYTFVGFAAIQSYSHTGRTLLELADKYGCETSWHKYDKIFIVHNHYKTGIHQQPLKIWIMGVSKDLNACNIVFSIIE